MNSAAQPSGVSTGPHLDNRRVAAALIDLVAPVAIGAVAYAAGLSLTRGVLLVAVGWTLYYFFALESGDGQTLGKRVMKLRVVSADGSPASMEQIAKRTVVRVLDGHIVGLIVMLATGERRQRLGDIVARTMVADADSPGRESTTARHRVEAPVSHETAPTASKRRSLKLPALRKPSLSMSSLRGRSRKADADLLAQAAAASPAAPAPLPSDPEPGDHGPKPIEAFLQREVVVERVPEVDELERYESVLSDEDSAVELDAPDPVDYEAAVEAVVEYEAEFERTVEREAAPEPDADADHEDVDVDVKPIETISAIDLVMEEAEARRPGDRQH